jgi:4-hydroxy-tetrahydrodipicolinate synthase
VDLEGVYVPVVSGFNADGSINESAYATAIDYNLRAGVRGIVVAGTTGEYYALSGLERRAQFELARDVLAARAHPVHGRAHLIAGCNAGGTRESIEYAQFAERLGFDAVMLAAPPTSLPNQRELAAHVKAIALEGGLPVVLYNYPARAGVEFGFEALDELADMPEVIAIKESSGDFSRFLTLKRRYEGRITVMCGSDDQIVDYMFWGVRSWLAGTANVLPAQHVAIVQSMNNGDHELGRRQFAAILPWVQHMEAGSYNQKVKAGLKHLGIDCGGVRQPLLPMSTDAEAELFTLLDQARTDFAALSAS